MIDVSKISPATKEWIDKATYVQLLEKWRFARTGDPYFQDETGDYFSEVMDRRKAELIASDPTPRPIGDAASDASKLVGWER